LQAQQRLSAAVTEAQRAGDERVLVARQALAKAEQGVADARVAGDRKVADSQAAAVGRAGVGPGVAAAGVGVRDPAGAGRGGVAHRQAGVGGVAAVDVVERRSHARHEAALSPAGKTFALFLFSLKGRFDELKATAQEGLLPGVQAGMQSVLPLMPILERTVGNAAKAMGDLFAQAGKALTSPFWKDFFTMIQNTVGPNLRVFGTDVDEPGAGLRRAADGLPAPQRATRVGAAEPVDAVRGVRRPGPQQCRVPGVHGLRAAGRPAGRGRVSVPGGHGGHMLVALAPIGPIVLQSIGVLADLINAIPMDVLRALIVTIGGLVIGFRCSRPRCGW
jgi:hypothetical protein